MHAVSAVLHRMLHAWLARAVTRPEEVGARGGAVHANVPLAIADAARTLARAAAALSPINAA